MTTSLPPVMTPILGGISVRLQREVIFNGADNTKTRLAADLGKATLQGVGQLLDSSVAS